MDAAVTFLSAAWVSALDDALRGAPGFGGITPFSIEITVTDVPGTGRVTYAVWIDETGAHAGNGAPADIVRAGGATIRLHATYATAVAITRGEQNAQTALAAGGLQIGGDIQALLPRADAFVALDDAARVLRGRTEYPPSEHP